MKFNYKKLASVLTSVVMIGSTVGLAAAANYPAPFVTGGAANVAVVYGSGAALTDVAAVADITSNLQSELAKQTAVTSSTGASSSITGEAAPLFTGSSKIYINDTLTAVKSAVTRTELPTVLKDGTFSGNTDATFTQTITLGSTPLVAFGKVPTSSSDPVFALSTSTSTTTPIYTASVSFNKAVNMTHADSKGQELTLFGQKFTVASSTDTTNLVLLKSAQKIDLSSDAPTSKVTIGGSDYTVELVSASSLSATVKVTNEKTGTTETKEVSENASKKVGGITIAVLNADSNNFKLTASVIAGAQKVTLTTGSAVAVGEEDTAVDGTKVTLTGLTTALTKIAIDVAAPNSDVDAILPGTSFADPVFGSFKIDFASMSVDSNSSARENIAIKNVADDKEGITFTEHRGNSKTVQFIKNNTNGLELQGDNDGRNISVFEGQQVYRNEYLVVGNEAEGYLLKVSQITNQTTGYSSDKVKFTDVFSGDVYDTTLTADGSGTVTIGGKVYTVTYNGTAEGSEDQRSVKVNYPDSAAASSAVIYPTIQTSKGAKLSFYEPVTIQIDSWDGAGTDLATLRVPNGNGYATSELGFAAAGVAGGVNWTITQGSTTLGTLTNTANSVVNFTVGSLNYALVGTTTANQTIVYLRNPATTATITTPAVVVFEEKSDKTVYDALVTTFSAGGSSDTPMQVSDVARTWLGTSSATSGLSTLRDSLSSDSKITKAADRFGSVVTLDQTDSKRKTATISYPDEQPYAMIYIGENSASIAAAGASGSTGSVKVLGSVAIKDSEVSSVAGKNLIVVGGSCVNSVAASLLGGALCGADFEAKTKVGAGSFLIKTYSQSSGTVATLVAGYNAGDTSNAAKFLTTQAVDSTVGKAYVGTSATSATLMTAESA